MWQYVLRVVIQLVLIAPILLFGPFAVLLAVSTLGALTTLKPDQYAVALTYVLSGLAVPILLLSILLTTAVLRRKPWRIITTVGLCAGILGAVLWVVGTGGVTQPGRSAFDASTLTLFGGPILVAVWNLWRAWRRDAPPPATSHP